MSRPHRLPEYSVVIPTYRRPGMLREAIESVFAQSHRPKTVYVVIDEPGESTDYGFLRDNDQRLDIQFTGGGKGAALARNLGIKRSETEYVFFLDDDDLWLPQKAEIQLHLLASRPDCIGVTCWREIEGDGAKRIYKTTERQVNRNINTINYAGSFSFFGYRKNAATTTLLLDESLASVQDQEFYMRLHEFGEIAVATQVLATYRVHGNHRISDVYSNRLTAFDYILKTHGHRMRFSERCWNRGRVLAMQIAFTKRWVTACQYSLRSLPFLLSSGQPPQQLSNLLRIAWRTRSKELGRAN